MLELSQKIEQMMKQFEEVLGNTESFNSLRKFTQDLNNKIAKLELRIIKLEQTSRLVAQSTREGRT